MNGTIVRFEGGAHDEAERLLPWLANGTLEGEDRALLERHLEQCTQCQRDLAELREWNAASQLQAVTPTDVARDWRRLRGRLGRRTDARNPSRWRERTWREWRQAAPWLRRVVVAQVAAIACIVLLAIPRGEPARYRTLGTPQAAQPDTLVIVFDPHASQARVQGLLRASRARIVDGPNDAGAYVIAVPAGRQAVVRDALRAAPGVTLVEDLSAANLSNGARQ